MDDAAVGWITAIIIGAIAGWLAEVFMKSNQGILMNIVLGKCLISVNGSADLYDRYRRIGARQPLAIGRWCH
jgi:hypothetical protein